MYFDQHKVIYDCSHSYLTISHMIHQHYTCFSKQFQLLEKRVRSQTSVNDCNHFSEILDALHS